MDELHHVREAMPLRDEELSTSISTNPVILNASEILKHSFSVILCDMLVS